MDEALKEMEARIIERAKFWDGYLDVLIRLREGGVHGADKMHTWRIGPAERMLREGLQQAIDAAMLLQRAELAECFMLAGVGGERAEAYARERAKQILGKAGVEFASAAGWVPTFWHQADGHE